MANERDDKDYADTPRPETRCPQCGTVHPRIAELESELAEADKYTREWKAIAHEASGTVAALRSAAAAPSDDEIQDALIAYEAAVYEDNSDEETIEPARDALLGILVRCRDAARSVQSARVLMTPIEREHLIQWHEQCSTFAAQTDDFKGERFHQMRAEALRTTDSRSASGKT